MSENHIVGEGRELQNAGDPIAQEMLGDLYKPETILTQHVEKIGENLYKITFVFPKYNKTIEPLDHVSKNQMSEAVVEGLYCVIGDAIKNSNIQTAIDFEDFQRNKQDVLYYRDQFQHRKMLKAGEPAQLTFQVLEPTEVRLLKHFYSVVVKIDGFMRGEVECLLEKRESLQ